MWITAAAAEGKLSVVELCYLYSDAHAIRNQVTTIYFVTTNLFPCFLFPSFADAQLPDLVSALVAPAVQPETLRVPLTGWPHHHSLTVSGI